MKRIVILGATGSIGTQALSVLAAFPGAFEIMGLSAGRNMTRLAAQVLEHQPRNVTVVDDHAAAALRDLLPVNRCPQIRVGSEGLTELVQDPAVDIVLNGISGFAGLLPTLRALEAGKTMLTANKETFVTAGHLVKPYLSQIVPLDSEHSAIFQCLQGCRRPLAEVASLYLTASGGPFRETPLSDMPHVTVDAALCHPKWTMGPKITIDCATMMNKGLETIEAHVLFDIPYEKIQVVIHPQSLMHSAVAFVDGSILAQLGPCDMCLPIQYGLFYPERCPLPSTISPLDLAVVGSLDFAPADPGRFPCLALARQAGEQGGTMPVVLNAADEMAVQAFLHGRIGFMDIPRRIEHCLETHTPIPEPDLETILAVDTETRKAFDRQPQPVT